jgi:hypothetical protein
MANVGHNAAANGTCIMGKLVTIKTLERYGLQGSRMGKPLDRFEGAHTSRTPDIARALIYG